MKIKYIKKHFFTAKPTEILFFSAIEVFFFKFRAQKILFKKKFAGTLCFSYLCRKFRRS